MRNIKLTIEYDGKDFNGWQKQPNKLNIQGTIEEAIKRIVGEEVEVGKIEKIIVNIDKQKVEQKEIINENSKWIENFKTNKNITELDRDVITELIDYIEVHENKKLTIHFKFAK